MRSRNLVNGVFERVADIALSAGAELGTVVGTVTAGTVPFRVVVTGTDEQGRAFQRTSAPLLTPAH